MGLPCRSARHADTHPLQVAMPARAIRSSRVVEFASARATEFSRANELYEKRDFLAALADYEAALQVPHLKLFALVNRGNAFKARRMYSEACASYQNALDEAPLDTPEGRVAHACVLNNLGAACLEARKMDQVRRRPDSAVCVEVPPIATRRHRPRHLSDPTPARVSGGSAPHLRARAQPEVSARAEEPRAAAHDTRRDPDGRRLAHADALAV